MKKWIMSLALCLLIPVGAMAVTEGVVEAADQVEMGQIPVSELSFLPDSSYYADYGDWMPAWENAESWVESEFDGESYFDVEQRPRMTASTLTASPRSCLWITGLTKRSTKARAS